MSTSGESRAAGGNKEKPGPSPRGDRRSAARLAAVQSLYEIEMSGASVDSQLLNFLESRQTWPEAGGLSQPNRALFKKLIQGVTEARPGLDDMLSAALGEGRELKKLDRVLGNILLAGAYELHQMTSVPTAVVIDEYVALADAFYEGKEPALVNGVLDRLAGLLRGGGGDPEEP